MKRKQLLLLVFAAAVLLSCSFAKVSHAATATMLEKMPVQNAAQELTWNAEVVKAGPKGIMAICDSIVPPGTGDDTKARYALGSLTNYATRPDADQERRMVAGVLAKALVKSSNKEVKFFFINQLQFVGADEIVPALAKYLDDERLCDAASGALMVIGTEAAEKAFLKALPTVSSGRLPMIVHALGQLQSKAAAGSLAAYVTSQDTILRRVAIQSLGNIGDESSIQVLAQAAEVDDVYERSIAASAYLQLAHRLSQEGHSQACVKLCRDVLRRGDAAYATNIQCQALSVLTQVKGLNARADLFSAVDGKNSTLHAAALALAEKTPGSRATVQWVGKLMEVSPDRQTLILAMLGRRGDKMATPAVREFLGHPVSALKLAALTALVQLDDTAAVLDLAQAMKTAHADEVQAVKSLLMQTSTEPMVAAVLEILPKVSPDKQVVLIDILAQREADVAVGAVFALTSSTDSKVNVAATRALAKMATQEDLSRLVVLMLNAKGSRQQAEAGRAIVTLCQKNEDVQKRAAPLLSAYGSASTAQKISIVKLLPAIGGKGAFQVVLAGTKSADSKMQDAAIRALAQWKDAEALNAQFTLASNTEAMNYHVMNLKAYIDLVAGPGVRAQDKVAHFVKAMSIARRPDEKKQAISKLALIRTDQALAVVSPFVGDIVLGPEASLAVVNIVFGGRRDQPISGSGVIAALQAVVRTDPKADVKAKVEKYLDVLLKERATLNQAPEGFVALFNGKDLTGWKGLLASPNDNPIKRARLSSEALAKEQAKADAHMRKHWAVKDGILKFDGGGHSLATIKDYEDFEMWVDWKVLYPRGDSGLYLRGTPQVQIWDPGQWKIGSGGLYNNRKNPSKPTSIADNPIGQWNTFYIKMVGERVTVVLNGELVVDNVILENYWDRNQPIFPSEQIELQCHGNPIDFRNIYIREIPKEEGFTPLFNGKDKDLTGWIGDVKGYIAVPENGTILCKPGGNLYTEKQYSDFHLKFDFKLTPGANNGLGIRTPLKGDAAYQGMELQILDNTADKYKNLQPYQYHGSVYGVIPAKRGFQAPVGQWNSQEVIAKGDHIKVILNGTTIVDGNIRDASKDGTMDKRQHPGLLNEKGHIGFLGHGSVVEFRNIRIKE